MLQTAGTVAVVLSTVATVVFSVWLRRKVKRLGPHFAGTKTEPPRDANWAGLPWAFFGAAQGLGALIVTLIGGQWTGVLVSLAVFLGFGFWLWRGLARLSLTAVSQWADPHGRGLTRGPCLGREARKD